MCRSFVPSSKPSMELSGITYLYQIKDEGEMNTIIRDLASVRGLCGFKLVKCLALVIAFRDELLARAKKWGNVNSFDVEAAAC